MIKSKEIFERKFNDFTLDKFYENPKSLKNLTNINNNTILDVMDNELFVNEDSIKIKNEGVIKEMIIQDNKIILQEIT